MWYGDFCGTPPSPRGAFDFENELQQLLRETGRVIVAWSYNALEPDAAEELPRRVKVGSDEYRRNRQTRREIGTLFGKISLRRFVYQACLPAEPAFFPLEHALGVVAGLASPALAEQVGRYAADLPQQQTLAAVRSRHGIRWSVGSLRKIIAAVAESLSPQRHTCQVEEVLRLLRQAAKSRGKRRPTLVVGRDGVMIPMRPVPWEEAATGTLSVYDRAGKRLGTVYVGQMPESGQTTLSKQLTELLNNVLKRWTGKLPRLIYVTDAGSHARDYFRNVLRKMRHPRTGEKLRWRWIVDYYHACQYVGKLAETIFGAGREASAWSQKMRRTLKNKHSGAARVRRSATTLRSRRGLRGSRKEFDRALNYLQRYDKHMKYAAYRKQGLAISSGVTEAACKTIFSQRFKQSGMSWHRDTGQHIVDLRVIVKSNIWNAACNRWLSGHQPPQPIDPSNSGKMPAQKPRKNALPA